MPLLFDNEEDAYLRWVAENPTGFIVNLDRAKRMPMYPMIHAAIHRSLSSAEIGNFTTGDYIKICGNSRQALEAFCEREYGRMPQPCLQCLKD